MQYINASRRRFLQHSSLLVPGLALHHAAPDNPRREPLPVAAIVTAYYPVSHADVIVSKILEGYQRNGGTPRSGLRLVSMYVEQSHPHDISRELAQRHHVRLCKSIDEAITFGTDRLQVSGVLSIAEHGDYPLTPDTLQKMYPRRRFFDETVAAFRRCNAVVPCFNDKHLGYRWEDASAMVQTARLMNFPLLAGSSLPVTWRFPQLELPLHCEIESALTIGYGPLEDYGFHALEAHQCQIERRRGGEAGVRSIEVLLGRDILQGKLAGRWSAELFAAARHSMPGQPVDTEAWDPLTTEFDGPRNQPAAFLITHRDGLQSAVIMTAGYAGGFSFACRLKGENAPRACWFKLQEGGVFGHFSYLLQAFEETIRSGKPVYPTERTLLTTGILDRCMKLAAIGGGKTESPELGFQYHPTPWPFANHPDSALLLPHD
ncbi:MAG: hypothetical protein RLZZ436_2827 [Planctomycetota bacterium]|jgi:hypothetical protein